MAEAFSKLAQQVRDCSHCHDLPLGPRPVLQLHPQARILVAGQAPGRKAHERGVPFDDPSGDRLRDWMGLEREDFYDARKLAILPMGFCYPGTGKGGDLPPRPECAPLWRTRLLAALPNIQLTLVIGAYAHAWHLGDRRERTLTETVKNWRAFWPNVMPLPHPSPRNQRWFSGNPFFEAELVPALRERVAEILSPADP